MGNKNSTPSTTNYTNAMSFINSSITKNTMEVNNSCQQQASAEAFLTIKGDAETNRLIHETQLACIAAGINPKNCRPTYRLDGATI